MIPSVGLYAAAISLASAWLVPATDLSVVLSWIGILLLCLSLPKLSRPYRTLFRAGVIMQIIGFHWLFFTIRDFGGFGNFGALIVFSIFALGSALQLLIFVFVWRNLPRPFHDWNVAIMLAWVTSEALSIRIFPWHLGHTQLTFTYFAQVADIAGAMTISAILVGVCESFVALFYGRWRAFSLVLPLLFVISVFYGKFRVNQINSAPFIEQEVVLVQGNVTLEEKHNLKMFRINVERYRELTDKIAKPGLFIIWPETVITEWIFSNLKSVKDEPRGRLPHYPDNALLLGSLTFESEKILHNSALGIQGDGTLERPYHKQILMPFGEYTPFGDVLPWIRDLNSTAGDFSPGDGVKVFEFKLSEGLPAPRTIKVAPLICYEDVMPRLGREATLKGADLLVNIANDAWFGDSIAPYEHNLIASFRAIETRRYLLRATNSGMTAIINPLGKIESELPPFSEGVLQARVKISNLNSPFVTFFGDLPFAYGGFLIVLISLYTHLGRRRRARLSLEP